MATGEGSRVQALFDEMSLQGGTIVQEIPKLDLELYIQNYRGRTRFERLLTIGRCCVPLCIEALKAAIAEAKDGKDVSRYKEVVDLLKTAAPGDPDAKFDQTWVDRTSRDNRAVTHQLESQLKGYKNNLIKESIRMGNEDLGRHFESIGDLASASEAYSRMRPDVSTSKHIVDVGKHLVNISVQRRDWPMVLGSLTKITGIQSDDDKSIQPYVKIVQGIALMAMEKYEEAAATFLQIDAGKEIKHTSSYNNIASPNDVAVYGGLCALATMGRMDLQQRVLDNQNFRTYLELEPHIRKAISMFVNGRYSGCLSILESYRADYLLDVYLQKHVPAIYSQIRSKCIVQYFTPFSCVTISSLSDSFGLPGRSIEPELVSMIKSGALQARINTIDKVLVAVNPNQRTALQASTLATTQAYEREAAERIRRMSLIAADMEVVGARKMAGVGGHEAAGDGTWFDNNGGDPMAAAEMQV